jgi:ArsR family transcriptional regulator
MKLVRIYECLCDGTRLRLLNLLLQGPLCVCHLQELLGLSQVHVSRHLAYLKKRGMVEAERSGHWMIYRLPRPLSTELEANLKCLQDCRTTEPVFGKDLARLKKRMSAHVVREVAAKSCCP